MKNPYFPLLRRGAQRGLLLLGLAGLLPAAQAQVSFGSPVLYPTNGYNQGIVTADFNGDGRPDLATANSSNNLVGVLLQSGTAVGTFLAADNYSSGGNFNPTLAVGDLNGDGRPDLATINELSGTVGVLLGSAIALGSFEPVVTYSTGGIDGRGIAIADADGDGLLDLLVANDNTVGILLNSAAAPGTFGAVATYPGGGPTLDELAVGDLNGDSRPDVVVASRSGTTVSVLLNSAATPGTLGTAQLYTVGNSGSSRGVALGDLNNDGRLDIAASNYNDQTISVLLNSATVPGTFASAANYSTGSGKNPYGVTIGDLNGDGRADIVASNYNLAIGNTVSVLVNSATTPGTFAGTPTTYNTGGTGPIRAVIRDLNNDGRPDLAVSNFISDNVSVLLNTTAFAAPGLTTASPTQAAVGTSVTLTGTNLSSATAVSFNGAAATTFAVVNATTITATVPAGATSGPVTVTTPGGTSGGVALVVLTATPTLTMPAANAPTVSQPTFTGTALAGSTVTLYVAAGSGAAQAIGTTTATGGTFSLVPATALASGNYTAFTTAQLPGQTVSANSTANTFTVDATPPTATITSTAGPSGSTTTNLSTQFTVTFSEPVTGFAASGISITNGSLANGPSGSGTTYTFLVSPSSFGTATTVSLVAGAAQDAAGNPSAASGSYSLTYTRPLSVAPVILNPTNGTTTPGVLIIGGSAPTGSFVGITVTDASGYSVTRYTAAAGNNSFSSQFSLSSGTYQAVATGQQSGNQPASSAPITFTVDATPPTATITSTAASPTSTAPIPFTVSFSEPVSNFTTSSVSIANGTITTGLTSVGNDYSFGVTPTASGPVTVTLPANSIRDRFSNYNTSASSLSVTYASATLATTWTGAVSTDWFDAGNWTQGVPTASLGAAISPVGSGRYPLIAAGTALARSLSLNPGAILTMSDGSLDVRGDWNNSGIFVATGGTVVLGTGAASPLVGSSFSRFWSLQVESSGAQLATSAGASVQRVLTLNGNFSVNGNPFVLLSNAAGTALVVNNGSNVVSGTATVQRAIDPSLNPGPGYRHYSSPVSNSTVADGFSPVVNPAYNTSPTPSLVLPFPTVFGYDDSRLSLANNLDVFDKGFFSPAALSDPLAVGRGYAVNIAASQLVDFQGTLNNGDLTLPLTSTRNTYPTDGGWQFLGNPYPAPLDYSRVAAADRLGLESAIYVYSSTSQYQGRYRVYINGIGNPVLPVGQAFFARVASGQTSATMTFRNSQRLTVPNGTTFQRTTADLRPQLQLELRAAASPDAADEFFAYAESGATPAFDAQLDAQKLPNPTGFNLAGAAASGEPLAVDARAAFTAATVLPLTVGVPAAGAYTLSAAALANLPTGLDAFLADDLTGQTLRLSPGTRYAFSVSAAQAAAPLTGRFRLLFRPVTALATVPALTADAVGVYPNPAHERFTVTLPGLAQATSVQAELLNALGQVVRRQTAALPASGTQLTFDAAELATGVYTLRLQAGASSLAKRVVIE